MEGIVYGGITRTGSATTVLVQRYDSSGDGPDNGEGGRRVYPSLASNAANTLSNVTQTNSMDVQRSVGEIHQDYATATMTITSTNDSADTDGTDNLETLGGVNSALNDSNRLQSSDSVRDHVVLRLAPTKKKKKKKVCQYMKEYDMNCTTSVTQTLGYSNFVKFCS